MDHYIQKFKKTSKNLLFCGSSAVVGLSIFFSSPVLSFAGNALPNASPVISDVFEYTEKINQPLPIPEPELHLQTVLAKKWFDMPDKGHVLEGAIFDGNGNLVFCDASNRRIMRLSPKRELSVVLELKDLVPAGLGLHNGRLYVATVSLPVGKTPSGAVLSMLPDGSDLMDVVSPEAGYVPDDLAFDKNGGFYFTDFKGKSSELDGGVYYVHPDHSQITPVLLNLAKANGIALSHGGRTLWITEYANNRLHRLELADATTVLPNGSTVPYHFIAPAPDSVRVDADGNVYVTMHRQGRIMVLNPSGVPIGQILIPGRENGHFMKSTSLAIFPAKKECLILAADGDAGDNMAIFSAPTFSPGTERNKNKAE